MMSAIGATSTSRPAYMMPSRSANCAINPMSWPTRVTAAPGLDMAGRLDQAQDRQGQSRFPGAAFAGQTEALARHEREADIIDRAHLAERMIEGDPQTLDPQDRPAHAVLRRRGLAISSS